MININMDVKLNQFLEKIHIPSEHWEKIKRDKDIYKDKLEFSEDDYIYYINLLVNSYRSTGQINYFNKYYYYNNQDLDFINNINPNFDLNSANLDNYLYNFLKYSIFFKSFYYGSFCSKWKDSYIDINSNRYIKQGLSFQIPEIKDLLNNIIKIYRSFSDIDLFLLLKYIESNAAQTDWTIYYNSLRGDRQFDFNKLGDIKEILKFLIHINKKNLEEISREYEERFKILWLLNKDRRVEEYLDGDSFSLEACSACSFGLECDRRHRSFRHNRGMNGYFFERNLIEFRSQFYFIKDSLKKNKQIIINNLSEEDNRIYQKIKNKKKIQLIKKILLFLSVVIIFIGLNIMKNKI